MHIYAYSRCLFSRALLAGNKADFNFSLGKVLARRVYNALVDGCKWRKDKRAREAVNMYRDARARCSRFKYKPRVDRRRHGGASHSCRYFQLPVCRARI